MCTGRHGQGWRTTSRGHEADASAHRRRPPPAAGGRRRLAGGGRADGRRQPGVSVPDRGGQRRAVIEVLLRRPAFDSDLAFRFFPNTGPRIRDQLRPRWGGAARSLHPRWRTRPRSRCIARFTASSTPSSRTATARTVETELHSQLHRVEQQVRWQRRRPTRLRCCRIRRARVGRLLVLRNTRAIREVVRSAGYS